MKFRTFSQVYLDKPVLDYAGQPYIFEGKPMTARRFIELVSALPNRKFVHVKFNQDGKVRSTISHQFDKTLAEQIRNADTVDDDHGLLAVAIEEYFKPHLQRVEGD